MRKMGNLGMEQLKNIWTGGNMGGEIGKHLGPLGNTLEKTCGKEWCMQDTFRNMIGHIRKNRVLEVFLEISFECVQWRKSEL